MLLQALRQAPGSAGIRSFALAVSLLALAAGPALAAGVDAWTGGGPDGGWVISLLQPFGPDGVTYVGTYGGGIFTTRDGVRWEPVAPNAPDAIVWDLEFGADGSGTLYAATEDRGALRARPGETFWTPVNTGLNDPVQPIVWALEVKPDEPTLITAGTSRGVFHSRNRGTLWPDSLAWSVGVNVPDVEVPPRAPNTTYALTNRSLLISPDRGESVSEIEAGLELNKFLLDVELWPASLDSAVIADFDGQIYQLRDQERFVAIGPAADAGAAPRYYKSIVLGGDRPVIYVGADQGLYRSDDVGAQWTRTVGGSGTEQPEIWTLLSRSDAEETLLLGSFRFGLLRTESFGEKWSTWNEGLTATWSRSVHAWGDEVLTGDAHGRIHHSVDAGTTWTDVTGDLDALQVSAVFRVRGNGLWLAGIAGDVRRSDDGGATWPAVQIDPDLDRAHRFTQPRWIGDLEVLAGTDVGPRRSEDGGLSWIPFAGLEDLDGNVFVITAADDSTVVLAVEPQGLSRPGSFHVGRWGSAAWERFEVPPGFGRRVRGMQFVDGNASQLIVATLGGDLSGAGALYRIDQVTDPTQRTFTSLDGNIPVPVVYGADLVSDREGNLYLGLADDGVYRSDDGGGSWVEWGLGLGSPRVEELFITRGAPGRIYAATLARGVFGRELDLSVAVLLQGPWLDVVETGVRARFVVGQRSQVQLWRRLDGLEPHVLFEGEVEGPFDVVDDALDELAFRGASVVTYQLRLLREGQEVERAEASLSLPLQALPERARLLPARPNPFNPRTTLVLEVDRAGPVQLDVFDLRGRRVRRLFRGEMGAGRHTMIWDGTDPSGRELASGIYVVRAVVSGRSLVQRITLIR